MKLQEKWRAIDLRKRGNSYSEILKLIPVSKSTISLWLRDIELTSPQRKKLLKGRELARYRGAKVQQESRIKRTEEIIRLAKGEFFTLAQNPLFLGGLMLYLAEGDKHKAERVKFTNSDPALISFMMRWFREILHVPEGKMRIALHIHNLHSSPSVQQYWMQITKIPQQQFHKPYIKETTLRQRRNVLYNGTCGIVVSDKNLFRKIMGWRLGLLKYFRISP